MEYFEQYLAQLNQSFQDLNYAAFFLNLVVTAVLSYVLGLFYVRFGNSSNNRQRFARNFVPLAMTTMLIIFIVKSSVALSLGLVGALSIVRFRAAIKEPEELVFLFLTIGLGLAAGAGEIVVAVLAFVFIILLLYVQSLLRKKGIFAGADSMLLNLSTTNKDLNAISAILSETFSFVELKRIDDAEGRLDASFVISAKDVAQIEQVRKKLAETDPAILISFVEQRNLAV
jgi:uncharacterized membrane protein YhiD involved in acid resistance